MRPERSSAILASGGKMLVLDDTISMGYTPTERAKN
jgi:hypothetical protein